MKNGETGENGKSGELGEGGRSQGSEEVRKAGINLSNQERGTTHQEPNCHPDACAELAEVERSDEELFVKCLSNKYLRNSWTTIKEAIGHLLQAMRVTKESYMVRR
jgi:hypothetical protein